MEPVDPGLTGWAAWSRSQAQAARLRYQQTRERRARSQQEQDARRERRAQRKLEEEELARLLSDYLNNLRPNDPSDWELRFTRPWTPLAVPDGELRAEVLDPAPSRIGANSILRFELRAGSRRLGTWQVPVQARQWKKVLVAESALQRGQLLREAPLTLERPDVLALRDTLTDLPQGANAYEIVERVAEGTAITPRMFRLKPVVFRGQTINAIVHDQAMTITLKVEVLEEGVPGQFVRVRNPQSRRELRGRIQDEHTIYISL